MLSDMIEHFFRLIVMYCYAIHRFDSIATNFVSCKYCM